MVVYSVVKSNFLMKLVLDKDRDLTLLLGTAVPVVKIIIESIFPQ